MTTSEQIRAAWKAGVFDNALIAAETANRYAFDFAAEFANLTESTEILHEREVNFFQYLAHRTSQTGSIRGTNSPADRFTHTVIVDYFIERDLEDPSRNYNEAIRVIELLDDLVRSELGKNWSGTVDYYEQSEFRPPAIVDFDGKKVWRVGYTYVGTKTTV